MTTHRYIRDTVANYWKPEWQINLDKQLSWLDLVEEACKELEVEVALHDLDGTVYHVFEPRAASEVV